MPSPAVNKRMTKTVRFIAGASPMYEKAEHKLGFSLISI
jgi:hypothetical protein